MLGSTYRAEPILESELELAPPLTTTTILPLSGCPTYNLTIKLLH